MVSSPIGRVLSRHAERAIREALDDTRVVLVNGARQSGKSTLLRQFARGDSTERRDLERDLESVDGTLTLVSPDPSGYVAELALVLLCTSIEASGLSASRPAEVAFRK